MARDEGGVIAVEVAEGRRDDAKLAAPAPARAKAAVGAVDEALGGKASDSGAIGGVLVEGPGAPPAIASRKGRVEPRPWDDEMRGAYERRNRIERAWGQAERFGAFATRHEKLGDVHLGPGAAGLRLHPSQTAGKNRQHALVLQL